MRIQLGIPMTLGEIARAMRGRFVGGENALIKFVTTDSREVSIGDLYIPLSGERFDGEDFVGEVTGRGIFAISAKHNKAHIIVENTADALLAFASYYSKNLPYILYKIGITGSVGKTTTKEFTKILLSEGYRVHANEGNFNNEIGLPMSVLEAPKDSQILIAEMGMNHVGEIRRLSKCVCPDMAVITNIGTSHIGNLGSKENIAKAKLEIIDGMSDGVVYVPRGEPLLSGIKNKKTVSLTDKNADLFLESNGHTVSIYNQGEKYTESAFAFKEDHLKKCLIFACATAIDAGISPDLLSGGISNISIDNIRQKMILHNKYLFYTDFYNASPESILASFDSVRSIKNCKEKSLVLGDVLELGEMSEDMHYEVGKKIPLDLFKSLFLFGSFAESVAKGAISKGFPAESIYINTDISNPEATALQIKKHCNEGELILMKASRGVRLERVLEYFTERS